VPTTFKDYYAVLGVPRTATEKEIHSAFRKLARRHHPDVNPNDRGAADRFKEINEAHEVLGDPEKRRRYDELGPRWQEYEAWERAGKPGPNPFTGGAQPRYEYRTVSPEEMEQLFGDSGGFSDFFQTFFGGAGAGGGPFRQGTRRRPSTPAPQRGEDVEGEVEITLAEAYRGTTRTVQMTGVDGERRVELRIPAGIRDGMRIRAAGQGTAGAGGGGSGDLYVRVRVHPDSRFTRDGDDLTVRVAVPLDTAILGGEVPVTTPRASTVSLTIPAGTQNGAKLRLRGQGMPHMRGEGAGDLIATVDVRLPVPVPESLRDAAEQLRGAQR
jgi:DnaJ-class molecular chaperone